jgi:hypothetical protein
MSDGTSPRCRRCGRPLFAPESVERGIGPDCAAALDSPPSAGPSWAAQPRPIPDQGTMTAHEYAAFLARWERAEWARLTLLARRREQGRAAG